MVTNSNLIPETSVTMIMSSGSTETLLQFPDVYRLRALVEATVFEAAKATRARGQRPTPRNFVLDLSRRPSLEHGRRSRGNGGQVPPEFGVWDAKANCPPQILSYRYKKGVLKPSKYAQKIRFRPGFRPDPAGGAHDAPPDPLVGWRRDTLPIPYPTRHRPTFSPRHASPRIPARSTHDLEDEYIKAQVKGFVQAYRLFVITPLRDRRLSVPGKAGINNITQLSPVVSNCIIKLLISQLNISTL